HCGREPDALRSRGEVGEHQIRGREHAQRVEMVLADPSRVHAEPVGVQGLLRDVGDELVRRPRVVFVVIIAQGEVAEFHNIPPSGWPGRRPILVPTIIDAFATVVNATELFGQLIMRPTARPIQAGPPLTSRRPAHKSVGKSITLEFAGISNSCPIARASISANIFPISSTASAGSWCSTSGRTRSPVTN